MIDVQFTLPYGVEARICKQIADRAKMGLKKYGVTVADNPLPLREWLEHQKMELLDAAIYVQRAIDDIDEKAGGEKEPPQNYRSEHEWTALSHCGQNTGELVCMKCGKIFVRGVDQL